MSYIYIDERTLIKPGRDAKRSDKPPGRTLHGNNNNVRPFFGPSPRTFGEPGNTVDPEDACTYNI